MQENYLSLVNEIKKIRKIEDVNLKCLKFKFNKLNSGQSMLDILPETQRPKKIDMKKACKYTGLKYGTCYDKLKSHKVNYTQIGRKPIYDMKDISEFILTHKVGDWSKVSFSNDEIVFGEKVDIEECSELTGLCYDTFYSHIRRDNLPHIKYGNKAVFLKDFIDKWVEGNGQKHRK